MKHALYYVRLKNKQTVCTICNPISESVSGSENTLFNFIKSIYSNELIKNDRKILDGKELDIFIPEKKIAIEFDGLYWHNSEHVYDTFHLWKTEECEKQGIQLIHVFEDEWIYKQKIVKSRLKSLLGLNDKIYARKTECRTIDVDIANAFLYNNHIESSCPAEYNYGLFYNDELISVMTFGKNEDNEFELLRFANKLYTNVVGGASKLFSHFRKDHPEIEKIVSFADRRWSKGNLYEKLGFEFITKIAPKCNYVIDDKRYEYADNASKIYDSGKIKYKWE